LGINLVTGKVTAGGSSPSDALIGISRVVASGNYNTLSGTSNNVLEVISGSGNILTLSGTGGVLKSDSGSNALIGLGDNETLFGGSGSDTLSASGSGDTLIAGSGANTLIGYGSNETLIGGSGADALSASGTGDTLIAGSGINSLVGYGNNEVLIGGSGTDTLLASGVGDTLVAGSGTNTLTNIGSGGIFDFNVGSGQAIVVSGSAANSYSSNELDFGTGISDTKLWLLRSGNDLQFDLMGTNHKVTVSGWFSSIGNDLSEITAGGLKLDSQVSQLVQAMATYSAANPGFDPTIATQAPNDTSLQSALASSWHS